MDSLSSCSPAYRRLTEAGHLKGRGKKTKRALGLRAVPSDADYSIKRGRYLRSQGLGVKRPLLSTLYTAGGVTQKLEPGNKRCPTSTGMGVSNSYWTQWELVYL